MSGSNDDVRKTIASLLHDANRPPFLFVGSGISRRYMDAPDWNGLLESVCREFDFMDPYGQYVARAREKHRDGGINEKLSEAATLMEDDFLERINTTSHGRDWWKIHEERITKDEIPAMKLFLAEHLAQMRPHLMNDELSVLRRSARNVGGIITTNYDCLMEDVFPSFQSYSRQSDLIFCPIAEVGEIYKIHGSVDAPETMVLDSADYARMDAEQGYLLAKIMTIFAEYPIIFLGYSFNDQDVRSVLATIARCAGPSRAKRLSSRFVFIEHCADRGEHKIIDKDYGSGIEMKTIRTNDFTPVYQAIEDTPQLYAPKVLRQLRQHLYSAAYSDDEAIKAVFASFEDMDELPQGTPIVVGIATLGYGKSPAADDLYQEMLLREQNIPADLVLNLYAEKLLPQGDLPLYYFISRYDMKLSSCVKNNISKKHGIDSFLSETERKRKEKWKSEGNLEDRSIKGLVERFGEMAYKHIILLDEDEIDVEELEELLTNAAMPFLSAKNEKVKLNSPLRKAIRILDFLKYGTQLPKNSAPLQ